MKLLRDAVARRAENLKQAREEEGRKRLAPFLKTARESIDAEDFESTEQYEAALREFAEELAKEAETEAAQRKYDDATLRERIERSIALPADYVEEIARQIAEKTGIEPYQSGLSEARYFEESGRKMRIAAHGSKPTYDSLYGMADIDLRIGDDLAEATHRIPANADIRAVDKVAADLAAILKSWETPGFEPSSRPEQGGDYPALRTAKRPRKPKSAEFSTWEDLTARLVSMPDEELPQLIRYLPSEYRQAAQLLATENDLVSLRELLEVSFQEAAEQKAPFAAAEPQTRSEVNARIAANQKRIAELEAQLKLAEQGAQYSPAAQGYLATLARVLDPGRLVPAFLKPVETRIAEEGAAGQELRHKLVHAQDAGEIASGKRMLSLYDAGFMKLDREQRFNLLDTLEGRAEPASDNARRSFEAVRRITDNLAAEAIAAKMKIFVRRTIQPDEPVPAEAKLTPAQQKKRAQGEPVAVSYRKAFEALDNYYPHVIPNTEALGSGPVRKDVVENLVRQKVTHSPEAAERFIDGYRKFIDDGARFDQLESYLVESGQAADADAAYRLLEGFRKRHIRRQGSLEYARQVDLPFYDPEAGRVLPPWIHSASLRLAQVREFGQDNQRATRLIRRIDEAGGDARFVRAAVDKILVMVDEPDTKTVKLSRLLRFIQGFKLGLAAIPNATQPLNVLLKSKDLIAFLDGAKGVWSKEGRRLAMESGASIEGVVDEMVRYTGGESHALHRFLKANGFTATERANRVWAANAGISWARRNLERLQKNPEDATARWALHELGLNPDVLLRAGALTHDDALMAAKKMADITQFRSGVKDLPHFAASPMGKVFFQFKNYIYGQTRLLYDALIEEIKGGRYGRAVAGLLILAVIFPLAGEAIADLRALLKGEKRKSEGLKRWFEDIAQTGALGMLQDLMAAGSYGRVAEYVAGPTVGDVAEAVESTAAGIKSGTGKRHDWRFYALSRTAFRRIPIFGPVLVNRVFPPRKAKNPAFDSAFSSGGASPFAKF